MLYFEELASRLGIDWSDIGNNDLFSETELVRWLSLAKDEAAARHEWPFTEGREEITSASSTEEYDYPTNMKTDSLRYLTVNGKRYQKLLFEDYLKYKEDYGDGAKKFYSDRNRILYINYLADDFGNSIVCYGQVEVAGTISSASTTSVFTMAEPEADESIIELAYAKALNSDKMKNPTKARVVRIEALARLDAIWKRILDRQHTYQTQDSPMFKRLNVLEGDTEDSIRNPNQF